MNELKDILNYLGLKPIWASIILLLSAVLIFIVKQYIDMKKKLVEIEAKYKSSLRLKLDDKFIEYSAHQSQALLEAFRMLYEDDTLRRKSSAQFSKVIKNADALVMEPLTEYSAFLDDSTKNHIYKIHNILEQFKFSPSEASIKDFFDFRSEFYSMIEKAEKTLSTRLIQRQE